MRIMTLITLALVGCGALIDARSFARAEDASAVLFEEEAGTQGRRFDGHVDWFSETPIAAGSRIGDLALRAETDIPDRSLGLSLTVRRTSDAAGSIVIDLEFHLQPAFPGLSIDRVAGVVMRSDQSKALAVARIVRLDAAAFRVELSNNANDRTNNLQLLRDGPRLDLPLVYETGNRAVVSLVKGASGQQAFARALASWN
jgi:hypothetical protein